MVSGAVKLDSRLYRQLTESSGASACTAHEAAASFSRKPSVLGLHPWPPASPSRVQGISENTDTTGYERDTGRTHSNACAPPSLTTYNVFVRDQKVFTDSRQGRGRSVFMAFGEYPGRAEAVKSAVWRRAALYAAMRECLHRNLLKILTVVLAGFILLEGTLCSIAVERIRFLLRRSGDATDGYQGQMDGEKASTGCPMCALSM